MSRTYSAMRSEHQKQSKSNFRTYFRDINELEGFVDFDTSSELEATLRETVSPTRQEFRRLARRMRLRLA